MTREVNWKNRLISADVYNCLSIVNVLRGTELLWFGHVKQKDQGDKANKISMLHAVIGNTINFVT